MVLSDVDHRIWEDELVRLDIHWSYPISPSRRKPRLIIPDQSSSVDTQQKDGASGGGGKRRRWNVTDTTPPQSAEIPLGIRTGSLALPCYLNGIRHYDITRIQLVVLTKRPRRLIGTKRGGIEKIEWRRGMEVEEKGEVGEEKEGHKSALLIFLLIVLILVLLGYWLSLREVLSKGETGGEEDAREDVEGRRGRN